MRVVIKQVFISIVTLIISHTYSMNPHNAIPFDAKIVKSIEFTDHTTAARVSPLLKEVWADLCDNPSYDQHAITQHFNQLRWACRPLQITMFHYDEKVVGFITFYQKNTQEGCIDLLAIDQYFRRKGYAKHLLQSAENELKKEGAQQVDIRVLKKNIAAYNLYTTNGYIHSQEINSNWLTLRKPI